MPGELKIDGIEKALTSFTEIARRVPQKVARKTLLKASTPVIKAARQNLEARIESKTGNLMESLKTGQARKFRKGRQGKPGYVVIGPGWPKGAHAHLVEYGHRVVTGKRHGRASNADAIAQAALGGEDVAALVADPAAHGRAVAGFVQPRPFMRPAIDSTTGQVRTIIETELRRMFESEAGKVARVNKNAAV